MLITKKGELNYPHVFSYVVNSCEEMCGKLGRDILELITIYIFYGRVSRSLSRVQ